VVFFWDLCFGWVFLVVRVELFVGFFAFVVCFSYCFCVFFFWGLFGIAFLFLSVRGGEG